MMDGNDRHTQRQRHLPHALCTVAMKGTRSVRAPALCTVAMKGTRSVRAPALCTVCVCVLCVPLTVGDGFG